MSDTKEILEHAQMLFEDLSVIYQMMAKHPKKAEIIMPQVDLNLKCLKELISCYPLAFSTHTEEFFTQLQNSHNSAIGHLSFSLLSTLSRQSHAAIDEIVPEKTQAIEIIKNVHYDFQMSNLLSNINTFIGFVYLAKKTNDFQGLGELKALIYKNFRLIDNVIATCLGHPYVKKQFTMDAKEQIQSIYQLVDKTLKLEDIPTKNLMQLTQHIMTTIASIKYNEMSA